MSTANALSRSRSGSNIPQQNYSYLSWLVWGLIANNISFFIYSSYQSAWEKALEYLNNLPPERQKAFNLLKPDQQAIFRGTVNPAEIIEALKQERAEKRSISRLDRFSTNIIEPFLQFSAVIDTVVQLHSGIGSPVWAPIKIILQECSPYF